MKSASLSNHPVLFLCTGNYYRSRLAEEIFNFLAQQNGLEFKASSKGLAPNLKTIGNRGPIAPIAVHCLEAAGYPVRSRRRWPKSVSQRDFETAMLVVGLNQPEHQPMVLERYPSFAQRVTYWQIPDVGEMPASTAFTLILAQVQILLKSLAEA